MNTAPTNDVRELALGFAQFLAAQCPPGELVAALMANLSDEDKAAIQRKALGLLMSPEGVVRLAHKHKDAAKMLGFSESKLTMERKLGKIHRTKAFLYPTHELIRYLNDEMAANKEYC